MKSEKLTIVALVIALFATTIFSCFAQKEQERVRVEKFLINPRIGIGANIFNSSFSTLSGGVDCGKFGNGSGLGFIVGASLQWEVINDGSIGLGLYYADRSGNFTIDGSFPARDLQTGKDIIAKTDIKIDAKLSYFEICPEFHYKLIDTVINGPLKAMAVIRFAIPMTKTYTETEKIKYPENAVFILPDGFKQERTLADGTIEKMNTPLIGISLGIEHFLKISRTSFITNAIVFDYYLNDIAGDVNWKTSNIRFETGIGFSFGSLLYADPLKP